ncbi:hypothetical protein J7F03_02600 [Streptomyces sp. ISL-43]|uniref:hypothetical protein n=1 Tax=Streptomyces sp. ISL-43 TaxID=2819183 RepID=UPI001BE9C087|nr:hypothetical protein [Streptomyces sp. ISL-43]MBT2445994.1 hypothetical protein [Streptomyces sp. ISL-43]
MITRPSDEAPGHGSGARPPGGPAAVPAEAADPTPVRAAAGLGLLALGGWLLTTARPWHKPGSPLVLGLDWAASGALLICGLVLLTRCIRTVHGADESPYEPAGDTPHDRTGRTGDVPPARPA